MAGASDRTPTWVWVVILGAAALAWAYRQAIRDVVNAAATVRQQQGAIGAVGAIAPAVTQDVRSVADALAGWVTRVTAPPPGSLDG
jgi:hypothetical protein